MSIYSLKSNAIENDYSIVLLCGLINVFIVARHRLLSESLDRDRMILFFKFYFFEYEEKDENLH